MAEKKGKRWSTARVLAIVIPVCLAVAVAVVLILVLGNGEAPEKGSGDAMSQEEMLEAYEAIRKEAEEAMAEMEDLASEEAASDPETYEQELEEAEDAYKELYQDLEEVTSYVVEVAEDYEELYGYIYDYYDYLYELTEQAVEEIDYLLSLVPTLDEMQGMEVLLERLESLPKGGKYGELPSQLSQYAQRALSGMASAQPPSGTEAYGKEMEALAQELASLAQELAQSISSGDQAAFSALAGEMNAAIAQVQHQLCAGVDSLLGSYASALTQLEAAIESALP